MRPPHEPDLRLHSWSFVADMPMEPVVAVVAAAAAAAAVAGSLDWACLGLVGRKILAEERNRIATWYYSAALFNVRVLKSRGVEWMYTPLGSQRA